MSEQMWEVRKECPLCHGRPKFQVRQLADYFCGVPGRWDVMRCVSCGHCFLSHTLPRAQLPGLYTEYFTHRAADMGTGVAALERLVGHRWWRFVPGCRAMTADVWRHTLDLAPGRLLELGCGGGIYLAWMARHGWDCAGQDVNPGVLDVARDRTGGRVALFCGEMTELPWADGSFDVVNSCNVLEHLPDPGQLLETAFRMLKPGGRLVIQTVNNQARSAYRFGRYWPGWDAPRHFHVFNSAGLAGLAAAAGFAVDSVACRPAMITAGVGRQALEWEARDRGWRLSPLHSYCRACEGRAQLALECLGLAKSSEALILIARKR